LVAQTLKNEGFQIQFHDGNYDINYKTKILNYVSRNRGKILFIGFYLALLQVKDCIEIIKSVKSIDAKIPIVIGGPFPSVFPELVMKSGIVNVCCTGDGAKVAKELAHRIAHNKSLHDIPNITFMDKGKIVSNPRTLRDDLNENNRIYYENFIDIELYVNDFMLHITREYDSSIKRAIPILTGLGCSYKCAFCENALLGHRHISLSAENILEQIKYLNKKLNIDTYTFSDEDFFIDRPRLFRFLELLRKEDLNIKWATHCRVNYFNERYINDKLLKEMERTGCVRLAMGVESGSPRMLKKIRKDITPEQAILAAECGKDSSIYFSYSFIIDLPDETNEDLRMTFNLMDKLLSIKKNSFISAVHHYFAYPGTPLSIELEKKRGYRIEDNFTFEQFGSISLKEYNNLLYPKKKNMYSNCIVYYHGRLKTPFQFKLNLRAIYYDLSRAIGLIRKKLNFYHLPLEIYLIDWLKIIIHKLRISRLTNVRL